MIKIKIFLLYQIDNVSNKKFRIIFKDKNKILKLKKLSIKFGKKLSENLNLDLNKGQILGLLGPNGAENLLYSI